MISFSVKEIINEITKNAKKLKHHPPNLDIPLQQRDFGVAMSRIKETVLANAGRVIDNSNYWCIVSAGAPGIGKFLVSFLDDLYRLLICI
jgi:hypothetical protein